MNGDSFSGNDLIYIPRDASEMNFVDFAVGATTFTAAQQAQAFDAYIQQDKYLQRAPRRIRSARRHIPADGQASRSEPHARCFPNISSRRYAGQFRIDFTNFGNLLNSNWGVGQRVTQNQILTNAWQSMRRAERRIAWRCSTTSW